MYEYISNLKKTQQKSQNKHPQQHSHWYYIYMQG